MPEADLRAVALPGGIRTFALRVAPWPVAHLVQGAPPRAPASSPVDDDTPSSQWSIRAYFEREYVDEALEGHDNAKSAGTRRNHRAALGRLQEFCGGVDPTFEWATRANMKAFRRWLGKHCRAKSTANKHLANLKAVLREAVDDDLCEPLGRIRRLRERGAKKPRAWSVAQLSKMLEAARNVPGDVAGVPACRFWQALVLVLYDSGARISACMACRWSDYHAGSAYIVLQAEDSKTDKQQPLGLSPQTAAALAAIAGDRELIFFWPWDPPDKDGLRDWETLRARFRRDVLRPAGLDDGRRDVFHSFRKMTATELKRAGGNATEQLGHSSPAVTQRYLDVEQLGASRQCDLLPRPKLPAATRQLRIFE